MIVINNEMLTKIKELQNETIQKAEKVAGSSEYIKMQTELFHEAEKYRKSLSLQISQDELEKYMKPIKLSNVDMKFLKINEKLQQEIKMLQSIIRQQEELSNMFLSA